MRHLQRHPPRRQAGLLRYHTGPAYQRGRGLGSFLGSLFRRVMPMAKTVAGKAMSGLKKVAQSDITKDLGKQLVESSVQGLADVVSGEDAKEVMQSKVHQAKQDIAQALRQSVSRPPKRTHLTREPIMQTPRKKGKRKKNPQRSKRRPKQWVDMSDED